MAEKKARGFTVAEYLPEAWSPQDAGIFLGLLTQGVAQSIAKERLAHPATYVLEVQVTMEELDV